MTASRELVDRFWSAMQANDWDAAAALLAEDCCVDWPCSGERIRGRTAFAAVQREYPSRSGRWSFDVHRVVAGDDGAVVVSEVTVTDGEQSARVVAFSEVADGLIAHQTEYWPSAYPPLPGRAHLVEAIEPIP